MSSLIVILLTQNSHWVYGGYKGSLELACKKLMERQRIDVEGGLHFKGDLKDALIDDGLALAFEGAIYPSEYRGDFDLFVTAGEGAISTKIGRLYMTKEVCRFISANTSEDIAIPLEDALKQWPLLLKAKALDEGTVIDHFYDKAIINKALVSDSRSGYKQLKRSITTYAYEDKEQVIKVNLDEASNMISLSIALDLDGTIVRGEIYIK